MRPATSLCALAALAAISFGCSHSSSSAPQSTITNPPLPVPPVDPPPPPFVLGDPLPGLTPEELAAFQRGRAQFVRRWLPSEGLGPMYNAVSCESCHSDPVTGGSAALYRNFYLAVIGLSTPLGGLPSPVIPAFGPNQSFPSPFSLERPRTAIPDFPGVVQVAQRNSIPIFGVGQFEFISNDTILANADPNDDNADGISGRANNDGAGMGRFGMKAQSNNVEFFTRAPLMNQMGITSNPFRGAAGTVSLDHGFLPQASTTPNDPTRDNDGVVDPEISPDELGDLIAFTRFLAPPQPLPFNAEARRGETAFGQIGCAKCHIPQLQSSRGPVRAYTDLLIHDMGSELADNISFGRPQVTINDPDNTTHEFRSAPLWGVSKFAPYLHDGRAATLDEAIRAHGGEGQQSRDAYANGSASQRADILAFLEHL